MAELVCPTCRKTVVYKDLKDIPYRPFCSRRCKLVDLGKWLNEEYRISEPIEGSPQTPQNPPSEPDPPRK